ncbi:DUF5682 family protein [Euzebya rosea]|uniref:DUF5682 family protein n=1 Tax=Euzebya rosea TaxID=2052804 RepID=UPI000D3E1426|nr:DUF5682 family protein [Euzebya rosea]
MPTDDVVVCGVRHHGPGSARSVLTVLEQVAPAHVVIEGPPELDGIVGWAGDADLVPPVAALVYRPDLPSRSSFYPMATFSPEWNALRWAVRNDVAVSFADLPATHELADSYDRDDEPETWIDPIGQLAAAAGYTDAERWWEDAVEHRHTAAEGFAAITEAIAAMRAGHTDDPHLRRREAAMRRVLRQVMASGEGPVVVVCGAYHAPALTPDRFPTRTADTTTLKGLRRQKVAVTWVPWTSGRLAAGSGYGAGVTSPGWYAHCYATDDDQRVERWMVKVARALRDADLPAPTASAIEAARLANSLASLRGRPHAGLVECTDAALAVLCGGRSEPLQVIHDEVVVGHEMGSVPDGVPQVPLARDLDAAARSARLRRTAEAKTIVCDLRTPAGAAKSILLHRLLLLGIRWGRHADAGGTTGTFKEGWTLQWTPELAVAVIAASVHGGTVEQAATVRAVERARNAEHLVDVVDLLHECLPADLPEATGALVEEVDRRAATTHDTLHLMRATEPLARVCRYGDVRQLDTSRLRDVLDSLVRRICAGLSTAVVGLDDDAALQARRGIDAVIAAVRMLDHPALTGMWVEAVAKLVDRRRVHDGIVGRTVRYLLDGGHLPAEDVAARVSRALSPARPARDAASWVDGFLDGDAALLLLDPTLLGMLDGWISSVDVEVFDDLLPLLRRTFSRYTPTERNHIGQRVRHGTTRVAEERPLDPDVAPRAIRRVLELYGAAT